MTATIQGQQTYVQFPAYAQPGQVADLAHAEIVSFPAYETVQPGRQVMIATDGLSCQQVRQTTADATLTTLGVSVMKNAREGSGAFNITAYGVGGPQYAIGDTVPVLMRGRIYAEWKGTTMTAFMNGGASGTLNVYNSSTIVTDRGKFTDAAISATTGSEISLAGAAYRSRQALANTGNIILLDVNNPGAA